MTKRDSWWYRFTTRSLTNTSHAVEDARLPWPVSSWYTPAGSVILKLLRTMGTMDISK